MEYPYYAFYKVAILTPKANVTIPVDAFFYISYLLFKEKWRYVYARKFGKARIINTKLIVPILANGTPDFEVMAKLTQQTRAYSIVSLFRENFNDKRLVEKKGKITRHKKSKTKKKIS